MTPKGLAVDVYAGLPVVTAARMRQIDFDATALFGVAARELMENAGRGVARETILFLRDRGLDPVKSNAVVVCGRGANGGDGLVAARHLKIAGASVVVFLCPPKKDAPYPELVRTNRDDAAAAGVEIRVCGPEAGLRESLAKADVVIDALLGTGSAGKPAGAIHHAVQEIARAKKPVVAVDLPTGIHPDTGHHSGVYVTADLTLTLGLAKRGLVTPQAAQYVGKLKVLDVGYPIELIRAIGR